MIFDLFSLYNSFLFTASIIMDSFLDHLNGTIILTRNLIERRLLLVDSESGFPNGMNPI